MTAVAIVALLCLPWGLANAQSPPDPAPGPNGPQNIFYGAVPPEGAKGPVIVFVHGLKGIAADWWVNAIDGSPNPTYAMAYAAGYRTAFVSLNATNKRDASTTWLQSAPTLKSQLTAIAANYNTTSLYVVAHSMGGLTVQAALLNTQLTALDPAIAPMVRAVFELATPNNGTALADWAFGKGAGLAILFGLHTPAVKSMQVATVQSFRATADPILAKSPIQFYTYAGNSFSSKDLILDATGLILLGQTPGPNDGLVPASSVPLPYSYSMDIGQTAANHFQMIQGNVTFAAVDQPIQGLERQMGGFRKIATGGFGDDSNTFIWSMKWFKGKLYAGTGRQVKCVTAAASDVQQGTKLYNGRGGCPPDPKDLELAAEIWQYTPTTKTWLRVYQSPENIPIGNDAAGNPVITARDIGFRGMEVFTEPDGTQALYVGSVTSGEIFGNLPAFNNFQGYPPPRIFRSVDGLTFTPLPQDPGTFLGNLTSSAPPDHHVFGIRSLTSYKGMLFATAGPYEGQGYVIASANPIAGNNAWFAASPFYDQFPVWNLEVFNNLLYAVGGDGHVNNGYFVAYTDATGVPPYTFTNVITQGANVTPNAASDLALSTAVLNNQLYVGTDGPQPLFGNISVGSEIVRVNPDNSYDLIIGNPRLSPQGQKDPASGIGQYFDNQFNRHFWRMTVAQAGAHQGLFMGTYDYSVQLNAFFSLGFLALSDWGTDIFNSPDGIHWKVVTATGFGDGNNYGTRAIEYTPFGLFIGTGRYAGGAQVWIDQTNLDFNGDGVIDQNDVSILQAAVGQAATGRWDPRDLDQDGQITANDVSLLSTQCTNPGCAPPSTPLPQKPPAPNNLAAATASTSATTVALTWDPVPGAARYRVYRQTDSPLLQAFPPGGVKIKIDNIIPLQVPQDILSGKLDSFCPPDQVSADNTLCTAVYMVEAAAQPGNQIGVPTGIVYLGSTTGTTFEEPVPGPLQSLYYVRAEDASGNLSESSNVVGAPSLANGNPPVTTPALTESPNALTFSATAGSSASVPPQSLTLTTQGGSTPLQFSASATIITPVGGTWLQLAQTSGTAPIAPAAFSLGVTVDPTGLAPGTYLASIVVAGQDGSSHPVTVTLNVAPGSGNSNNANALAVSKTSLAFTYTIGGTLPASQAINFSSASASAAFTVFAIFNQPAFTNWLVFNPGSGNTTVSPATTPITVSVAPAGLPQGTYSAVLLLADSSGNVQNLNVTLAVSSPASGGNQTNLITASAQSLAFTYILGGTPPASQTLQVITAGTSTTPVPFTVKAVGSNQWLSVSPVSASTPASLTVTATPRNLPAGTYNENLVFKISGTNINQSIPVTLTITTAAPPPPAEVASQLIPYVTNGAGWTTTILLVNNSTSPQKFLVSFLNDKGTALVLPLGSDGNVSTVSDTIAPGAQRIVQSDGSGGAVYGWAGINVDPSVGAFVTLNPPSTSGGSGASLSACNNPVQQMFLPFDQTSNSVTNSTAVALANPNGVAAQVTAVFTGDSGYPIPSATGTLTVPANGHYSSMLSTAFPGTHGKRGVAILTSTQLVCGLGIQFAGAAFTTLNPLLQSTAVSGTFGQVLNGGGLRTSFMLVNTGQQAASFTLKFHTSNGSPWTVPLGIDGNQASFTGTLAPGMMRILQSDGSGDTVQNGWASLSTTGSVTGTALFSTTANGESVAETSEAVSSSGATQLYLPYDQTSSTAQMATGIALVNLNATIATVNVVFTQANGQQTSPTQTIKVPASGQFAGVLGDVFPTIQGTKGVAYLVSDLPLMGTGMQFKGQAYTVVPLLKLSSN